MNGLLLLLKKMVSLPNSNPKKAKDMPTTLVKNIGGADYTKHLEARKEQLKDLMNQGRGRTISVRYNGKTFVHTINPQEIKEIYKKSLSSVLYGKKL
jgi:hypothetical protein